MKLAIITDSTCDLTEAELQQWNIERVPLYIEFQGKTHRDWLDITPSDIIRGVEQGADLPTTSQPTPKDFEGVYAEAATGGAEAILCLTISSSLSGTYQSATIAAETSPVPVTVFDSRHASLGLGNMVKRAAELRNEGASLAEIVAAAEHIRDSNYLLFTVASLDFLQKGGRIGRASALLGGVLNFKPILTIEEGGLAPLGRARGSKRALREVIGHIQAYRETHEGELHASFIHVMDPSATDTLKEAMVAAGISHSSGQVYEMGAVIASHVGPGASGVYLYTEKG